MADNAVTDNGNGKAKRLPISMKVATEFFDDIPEMVKLSRGRGQDLGVFQAFVQYLENGGNGRLTKIQFEGSDSAKQKAAQLRTALVDGKYPVPDGWNWNVAARPIINEETKKSVGSELYFQTTKKLAKNAKGTVTTSDPIVKRTRKAKKNAEETATAES
jgi:hypothetical protein